MGLFGSRRISSGGFEYIIAGLGNPGRNYERTRHNAGFITMDLLSERLNVKINKIKFKSLVGECKINGKKVLLIKPQTFMNNSGQAVVEAMQFYNIPPERVIIVMDDISLPVGKIRIRQKGSDGGQKGMRSIIYLSGSDMFPRVKIGVGAKPHPDYDLAAWVLSAFKKDELPNLKTACENAVEALELIIEGNMPKAMNLYN